MQKTINESKELRYVRFILNILCRKQNSTVSVHIEANSLGKSILLQIQCPAVTSDRDE